ncbi:hypothetical protein ACNOYE_20195 [Nannocystaceae bacterium ST9]
MDDFLATLAQGDPLEIVVSDQVDWEQIGGEGQGPLTFREQVWDEAEERCADLAEEQHPNRVSDNCNTLVDRIEPSVTPIKRKGDAGTCTIATAYGEEEGMLALPADSWDDYFVLANAIVYNSTSNVYAIDGAFFSAMLQNPDWLIGDGAYVDLDGAQYEFYNVASGTVVHALGIQTGDIPLTLNDIDISTMEGVFEAWGSLHEDTEFELVLLRGTNSVVIEYEINFTF